MMLPPKMRRSTIAAHRWGSVKVLVQLSGALVGGDRHAGFFLPFELLTSLTAFTG